MPNFTGSHDNCPAGATDRMHTTHADPDENRRRPWDVGFRHIRPEDEILLREYSYLAWFVPEGAPPVPRDIIRQPAIARYSVNWGMRGDEGLFAVEKGSGSDLGAAWFRLWQPGDTGFGFVDFDTSELSIAVRPAFRGRGIGSLLLKELLASADSRHAAVSLSVSNRNPAMRLYKRFGFQSLSATEESTVMLRMRNAS